MRVPSPISTTQLPSGEALRGPSGAGGTPEAFGAGIGASLQNLAANTMALGQYVRQQEEAKQRFTALRNFTQFQTGVQEKMLELSREYDPENMNYYELAQELYKAQEADFLKTKVPPELADEFTARAAEFGGQLGLKAAQFQYEANDNYFKQGIQDAVNQARIQIGQDGSRENLERERQRVHEQIYSSALSVTEQDTIARQADAALEAVAYRAAQIQRLRDEQSGIGTDIDQAIDLLTSGAGYSPDEAKTQIVSASIKVVEDIGSIEAWSALPSRVRAVLIAQTVTNGGLSPEIVEAVRNGDMEELAGVLRGMGEETAGDLILNPEAGIDNDPAFSNVPYETRLALLDDAEREVSAEITAQKAAETAQNASLVNALHMAITRGGAGAADIEQAYDMGILTDVDDYTKAYRLLEDRDNELLMQQLGLNIANGTITYAPGNEDHAKALNAVIGEEGIKAIEAKDGDFAASRLIPLVRQAGAIPSDVVDLVRGMIRSQDADKAYWALDLAAQMQRAAPMGFNQFPEADRQSVKFWQDRRDYMSQEDMMTALRGSLDPAIREARKKLREEGETLFNKNGDLVDFDPVSLFTGSPSWFFGMPHHAVGPTSEPVQQQLENDFETLFLDYYEVSGDVEYSKGRAAEDLKEVWSYTNVGTDNRLMKYPPEITYRRIADNLDWMEAQLRDNGILAEGEDFSLLTDTQTENEVGTGMPSYVLLKYIDGAVTSVTGPDGLPVRVNFDIGAKELAMEAEFVAEQARQMKQQAEDRLLGQEIKHHLDTGTPIPLDALPGSVSGAEEGLSRWRVPGMMPLTPEQLQTQLTGDPANRVGFETGAYRLPGGE